MKKITQFAFGVLFLISCKSKQGDLDVQFNAYKDRFIENFWKIYPDNATTVGYHNYDSVLYVPDSTYLKTQLHFIAANRDSLANYDIDKLSDANKTDFYLIDNQLKSTQWNLTLLKPQEWDPSVYNVSGTFAVILNEKYDRLDNRLKNFYLKMANIPKYYEAAKKAIKNPTKEHTKLAIEQNIGGASVFEKDFMDSLKKSTLPSEEKTKMQRRANQAASAIRNYVSWLRNTGNPNPRSFRLGKDLYEKKFLYDIQSSYSADEIYAIALKRKAEIHAEMNKLSRTLWPKYFKDKPIPSDTLELINTMIDSLSVSHVKPEDFQTAIEKQIPQLAAFVKQKNLLYLDPSKPLVVRKEPAYMAGVAGASITAPGPYDKKGNTYYNVGSLAGYSKKEAESYLREYNDYILQILNIHEAIPGHYAQLVYSNQSPSMIKSIFGNGAMIEGWAVYAERMMLEAGYGNNSPEMWLMYYKWHLRALCNTLLDYNVHIKGMEKEDAVHFLTTEAFQQQAEAEGKWRRATLTQVQLTSYFTGFTEIYNFREELKKELGDDFDLKKFNEKFLSYGSAPVKYIKELMEND